MSSLSRAFSPLDLPTLPRGAALGDEVYRLLGEAILDGRLQPGERVRDQEVAQQLGISRTPVREAIQRLERAGLIEVSPHRFTRVTVVNEKVLSDSFEFVGYMMGCVARLVCDRGTDQDIDRAIASIETIIDASRRDDYPGIVEASGTFFNELTAAATNAAIHRVMEESEFAIKRNFREYHPAVTDPAERTALYVTFRDALANRDGEAADTTLRRIHRLP